MLSMWDLHLARAQDAVTQTAPLSKTHTGTNLRFCYQDTELFPAYTGDGPQKPLTFPGVDIELLDTMAENLGVTVQYFRFSWNRCLALLKAGRIDSVIASFSEDRKDIARFPMKGAQPDDSFHLTSSGYYLYHLGEQPIWDGYQLLDPGLMIATPLGYSIGRVLKNRNFNIIETSTTRELLSLLLYKRVDAVAAPGNAADAILRNEPEQYKGIYRDATPIQENLYYLVFSYQFAAENPDLTKAFWQQMLQARIVRRDLVTNKYQRLNTQHD
ncbi:substrate-binding periplasmic protein [Kordiimonas aquimaris]|uniref:substrate-binding periplasmic protein n=1 Tax=Kordiimonas aquimaris TaxID=707591 RepID=UPI0021CE7234|nr:transporter substrate-binding domain-containing protein [Kordiimonas aquimaris]